MGNLLQKKGCSPFEVFEGYRGFYMATKDTEQIKAFNDDRLFKAMQRSGVKSGAAKPKDKKTLKEIGNSAILELRKIGAGAKIRQINVWYDETECLISGLQMCYANTQSKKTPDAAIETA